MERACRLRWVVAGVVRAPLVIAFVLVFRLPMRPREGSES
jgi:hypothetical protein